MGGVIKAGCVNKERRSRGVLTVEVSRQDEQRPETEEARRQDERRATVKWAARATAMFHDEEKRVRSSCWWGLLLSEFSDRV